MKKQMVRVKHPSTNGRWKTLTVNGQGITDMATAIAVVRAMGWYCALALDTVGGTLEWDSY